MVGDEIAFDFFDVGRSAGWTCLVVSGAGGSLTGCRAKVKTTTTQNKNTVTMGLNRTTKPTGYSVCVLLFLSEPFLSPCSDGITDQARLPR